jgi:hypothetical protein
MKLKKDLKKIICSLLITSMLVMPFFSVSVNKAKAETLTSYISQLTPVITKMPGCKKVIGAGIKDLYSNVKYLLSSKAGKQAIKDLKLAKLQEKLKFVAPTSDNIETYDSTTAGGIEDVKLTTQETLKTVKNQDTNENCLNSIGKAVAKILINKVTASIVNWIQTGDEGGPLFIQDPVAFLKDIERDEILGLGMEIRDEKFYPFGKDFLKAQQLSFTSKFSNNARYSLDEVIRNANSDYSAVTFNQDFSQGGWAAWDSLTQNAANNPLGFSIMASNELAKRIEEKTALSEGSLQQSGGYLGIEKCIDPEGITKKQDLAGKKERAASAMGPYRNPICNKWQVITPGKVVGDELVNLIDKKDSALLDVETLNDAVAAILDAGLSKLVSSLQEDGVAGLETPDPYDFNSGDPGFGNFKTEEDFSNTEINASEWLGDNPDFDIRTDLNQALIDEQRIYIDKLITQNKELLYDPKKNRDASDPTEYEGLIPTIYQLDYCIPGPNPNWKEESADAFDKVVNRTESLDFSNINGDGWLNSVKDLLGSLTLGIASGIVDFFVGIFGGGSEECAQPIAKTVLLTTYDMMTHVSDRGNGWQNGGENGVNLGDSYNNQFCSIDGFDTIMERTQSEYERIINRFYALKHLPSSTLESRSEYKKLPSYYEIYSSNENTIISLKGTIKRLEQLKGEIDNLNNQLKLGTIISPETNKVAEDQQTQYEINLKPWKNAFARISSSMYSGNDIATIDHVTKEIRDEKDYVYNDLIKTATGCEQEVEFGTASTLAFPHWAIGDSVRPDYPKPHLYNYPEKLSPAMRGVPAGEKNKSFTENAVFWDNGKNESTNSDCMLVQSARSTGIPNTNWVSECINISEMINLNSPWIGGSTRYWERNLGIY